MFSATIFKIKMSVPACAIFISAHKPEEAWVINSSLEESIKIEDGQIRFIPWYTLLGSCGGSKLSWNPQKTKPPHPADEAARHFYAPTLNN